MLAILLTTNYTVGNKPNDSSATTQFLNKEDIHDQFQHNLIFRQNKVRMANIPILTEWKLIIIKLVYLAARRTAVRKPRDYSSRPLFHSLFPYYYALGS